MTTPGGCAADYDLTTKVSKVLGWVQNRLHSILSVSKSAKMRQNPRDPGATDRRRLEGKLDTGLGNTSYSAGPESLSSSFP
jgi:hypothetical protein